eukprot:TRINITY_DN7137_c0_g1_i2.p1 TRINITY_DN7137_c0_g1~~TRINITY_DN7137_c0_g1_i2.p1  ORF type:complete len:745 (+),score=191.27 TRINITY_DN7137_c0_g1_i2:50-2236(+)
MADAEALLAWLDADDDAPPPRPRKSAASPPRRAGDAESDAKKQLPPPPPPRPESPPDTCARCGVRCPLRRDSPGDMICKECWDGYYQGSRPFNPDDEADWSCLGDDANRFRGTRTRAVVSRRVEVTEGTDGKARTRVSYDVTRTTEDVVGQKVLPTWTAPDTAHGPAERAQEGTISGGRLRWSQEQTASDPAEADRLKDAGNEHFASGDLEGAVRLYDEALALVPRNHVYLGNKAQALQELGRLAEAETAAVESVSAAPRGWWKGSLRLAHVLAMRREFSRAKSALDEALSRGAPQGGAVAELQAVVAAELQRQQTDVHQPNGTAVDDAAVGGTAAGGAADAVRVVSTRDKGKCCVALRDFEIGDVVLRERPVATSGLEDFSALASDFAGRTPDERAAALSLYCPLDDPRMPAADRDDLEVACAALWPRLSEAERRALGGDNVRLARLMAIHNCNALGRAELGKSCLYATACRIEHSCAPNMVYYVGDDCVIRFTAIRPIRAGDNLTFEYVSGYAPREARQEELQRKYYFSCACVACTAADTARRFQCSFCSDSVCPHHTPVGLWRCDGCGREADPCDGESNRLMEKLAAQQLRQSADGAKLDTMVLSSEGFHASHWIVREVSARQARRCAAARDWEEAERMLQMAADADRKFYPAAHPARAAALEMLAQVVAEQGQRARAEGLYREAEQLVSQGYGVDSPAAQHLRRCVARVPAATNFHLPSAPVPP